MDGFREDVGGQLREVARLAGPAAASLDPSEAVERGNRKQRTARTRRTSLSAAVLVLVTAGVVIPISQLHSSTPRAPKKPATHKRPAPRPAPQPSSGSSDFAYALTSVSCTSPDHCVAVGNGDGARSWSEIWNGRSWGDPEVTASPAGGATTYLASLSCPTATECVAVGQTGSDILGTDRLLAEMWNGTRWRVVDSVTSSSPEAQQTSFFNAVSCVTATSCVAVGRRVSGEGQPGVGALAESWNGKTWAPETMPTLPFKATGYRVYSPQLTGISCVSASSCLAVGSAFIQNPGMFESSPDFVEGWNGRRWALQRSISPDFASVETSGAYCYTEALCVAVGGGQQGTARQPFNPTRSGMIAESLVNGSWRVQMIYNNGKLKSVSCVAVTMCVAVGESETQIGSGVTQSSFARPVAAFWNGTGWSGQTLPAPRAESGSFLSGVSCASATACVAVGYSFLADSTTQPLTEVWDGSGWRVVRIVGPR